MNRRKRPITVLVSSVRRDQSEAKASARTALREVVTHLTASLRETAVTQASEANSSQNSRPTTPLRMQAVWRVCQASAPRSTQSSLATEALAPLRLQTHPRYLTGDPPPWLR